MASLTHHAPVTLHPVMRAHAYAEVSAAAAAAFSAHYSIDLAEGALVDCQDVKAETHIADAITEARRFLAHLGFVVVPFDEAEPHWRSEAERLIGSPLYGCACTAEARHKTGCTCHRDDDDRDECSYYDESAA